MPYSNNVNPNPANSQGVRLPVGTVGGGANSGAILDAYDESIFPLDNLLQLFQQHGVKPGYRMALKSVGFNLPVNTLGTSHFETSWYKNNVTVGSIVTPAAGAGNDMVIAIDPDDMWSVPVAGNTLRSSYPKEGDVLVFDAGINARVQSKNTSVNPHQLTLTPVLASTDLDSYVVSGGTYFISHNSNPEGAQMGKGRQTRVFKYTNSLVEIREAAFTSGTALTLGTAFQPVPGQDGTFFMLVQQQTTQRFEDSCSNALLFGTNSNNVQTVSPGLGYTVNVPDTEGLVTWASLYGHGVQTNPGFTTFADWKESQQTIVNEQVPTDTYFAWQGNRAYTDVIDVLRDYLGDVDRFAEGTGNDIAVKVGFKSIEYGGIKFMFKKLHEFDDIKGAGGPGYQFTNWSILTPNYMVEGRDQAGAAKAMPSIGYVYRSYQGYNRENIVRMQDGTGLSGKMVNTDLDMQKVEYSANIGAHFGCPNQVIVMAPNI